MKNESWRQRYLRLLHVEACGEDEYIEFDDPVEVKALYELEKAGYMRGVIIRNSVGTPVHARMFGPTLEGRIFAEDIQNWITEHTVWARIRGLLRWLGGWIVGIATAVIIHHMTKS